MRWIKQVPGAPRVPVTFDIRGNPTAITVQQVGTNEGKVTLPSLDTVLVSPAQISSLIGGLGALPLPTVTDTLLANGDSNTLGERLGVTREQTWVYKVGQARGFAYTVNVGVGGHTSTQMKAHWVGDLATYKPSAAVIMASANNATNGVSIAQNKVDMIDMINMAQDAGAKVTIASHWPWIDGTNLNGYALLEFDLMQELAGLPGVQFVDVWSYVTRALFYNGSVSSSDPYFRSLYAPSYIDPSQPDWIHASALGHQMETDLILKNPLACARG